MWEKFRPRNLLGNLYVFVFSYWKRVQHFIHDTNTQQDVYNKHVWRTVHGILLRCILRANKILYNQF
jgi:hypothetical protein